MKKKSLVLGMMVVFAMQISSCMVVYPHRHYHHWHRMDGPRHDGPHRDGR